MIKRLKVSNFKSLRDLKIDFRKFNVLVGRNNSGKSNIIDCIKGKKELHEDLFCATHFIGVLARMGFQIFQAFTLMFLLAC